MRQPVDRPSGFGAELRLYLAAGGSSQGDGFLRTVGSHADFFGSDISRSIFYGKFRHHRRRIIRLDDDSAAAGPVYDLKESGNGGFHHFLDVQGVAGIGKYVHKCGITTAFGDALDVKMVLHRNGVFLHRVLVFAFDDEERLVRILQRIGVEGALRHSLVGFGQHQEAAFGGGILN